MKVEKIMPTPRAPISSMNKGLGFFERELEPGVVEQLGWSLLHEDLSLPTAVLYEDALLHNLDWMCRFIDAYGLRLAPHGKTTMAPQLFEMQLKAGAWGITLATAHQTLVAYTHGVRRVLMANQLVGKENMAIVARLLQNPDFEFYCLVDSAALVDQLGAFFSQLGQRLCVLVELGVMDGRAGVRNDEQLGSVMDALDKWSRTVILSGIELYEGVLDDETAIRAFLKRASDVTNKIAAENRFQRSPILLSGAGSAWYDIVAEEFSSTRFDQAAEIVLRPGCYLTHDVGAYREAQSKIFERNPIACLMRSGLLPALKVLGLCAINPRNGKGDCWHGQA